jgi:GNAT acetyltransferase-like protein
MTTAPGKNHSDKARVLILDDFPSLEIEATWREFLGRVEFPAHYDTPEFLLEPYWDDKHPFAVLAFDDTKMVGVLTGLHEGKQVVSGLSSRPQICLDPKADPVSTTNLLIEGLLSEARGANLITVYSWASTPLPAFQQRGFSVRELEGAVVLDLSAGAQALFDGFAKNRRRDVRLAIRNGIEVVEETTEEDLRAYWEVYSAWRKTERKQIQHNRSWSNIATVHKMRQNHRRFLARYQGKVIAASGVRFCPGGMIEYANNCSLDEYMKLLPNDLLVWRIIEWACDHGFKRYCLGGAHPFLRKWGGTVVPINRYRLDCSLFRRHDLKESLAGSARNLLRRMPPSLQRKIRKVFRK